MTGLDQDDQKIPRKRSRPRKIKEEGTPKGTNADNHKPEVQAKREMRTRKAVVKYHKEYEDSDESEPKSKAAILSHLKAK